MSASLDIPDKRCPLMAMLHRGLQACVFARTFIARNKVATSSTQLGCVAGHAPRFVSATAQAISFTMRARPIYRFA